MFSCQIVKTWVCFFVKTSGDQLICVPVVYIFLRLSTFWRYEREIKFPLKDFNEFLMKLSGQNGFPLMPIFLKRYGLVLSMYEN